MPGRQFERKLGAPKRLNRGENFCQSQPGGQAHAEPLFGLSMLKWLLRNGAGPAAGATSHFVVVGRCLKQSTGQRTGQATRRNERQGRASEKMAAPLPLALVSAHLAGPGPKCDSDHFGELACGATWAALWLAHARPPTSGHRDMVSEKNGSPNWWASYLNPARPGQEPANPVQARKRNS